MSEIFPFFIVLLAGLVFSQVFQRLHVPWIIALIIGGVIIGPFGLDVIEPDSTLNFFKYLGLVFLMFIAGLETRLSGFRKVWKEAIFVGFLTGSIPLLIGLILGIYFGYESHTIIFIGIIFISSSIAVTIPTLKAKGILYSHLGKIIVSAIVLQDVASLILLAIFLQYITPGTLPLPLFITFFFLALLIIALVRWGIPRLRYLFRGRGYVNIFQRDLRTIFAVLIGGVIIFEILGLHAIISSFFIGLILSEIIEEEKLKEKIYVLSYGFFIPIFFVMVGVDTNLTTFLSGNTPWLLLILMTTGAIFTKFLSGWLSARLLNFSKTQATLVGGSCIPWLSTTLAIIAVGQQHNLLPEEIITTFIFLSMVTVFLSPLIVNKVAEKLENNSL